MENFCISPRTANPEEHQCRKFSRLIMMCFEKWLSKHNFFGLSDKLINKIEGCLWRFVRYKCYNIQILYSVSKLISPYTKTVYPKLGDVVVYRKKIYWVELGENVLYLHNPANGTQIRKINSKPVVLLQGDDWIRISLEFGKLLTLFALQNSENKGVGKFPPCLTGYTDLFLPETLEYDQNILIMMYRCSDF